LRERELEGGKVDVGFVGEGDSAGGGGSDAVLVDLRDSGVILGEDGEEEGGSTGREIVKGVEREGTEEEGEEEGRNESGEEERDENE